MKLDYLKEKNELVLVFLFGLSVFFAVLIMVKITGFFTASARAENLLKIAVAQNIADANDTDKYFTRYKVLADALKKNNLFAPPPPKQHPVKEVLGILGDEVLIKDKWYKIGNKVGDAKITAMGPTEVKIEWEGSEKVFTPMGGSNSEGPGQRFGSPRMRRTAGRKAIRTGEAVMVVVGPEGSGSGSRGPSGNLSEKERAKLQRKAEQKLQAEKEKSRKQLKRDTEKVQAKKKKDTALKKKRYGDSKSKKETAPRKVKK
ncbi:MAG: hypothetical protein HQ580_15470 [Planctomycetes bacterium]|nr:hypothetical protein [Planctomycetota bacterium]